MSKVDRWKGEGALPTLYSRTATGAVNQWICWVEDRYVCVRWGQVDGAQQEARFICLPKNDGRANATTAKEQAIKEAIAKWRKQLKKKYSESLDTAGETERLKPMLALDWKSVKAQIPYPVTVQPKLDGVRCLAYLKDGLVYLQSRGGDPWLLPHIQRELERALNPEWVLDGELYLHGMSLQSITSLAKRPRPESEQLYYCIYDMFHLGGRKDAPWEERKSWVTVWFGDWQKSFWKVWQVPNGMAASEDDVMYLHNAYAEQGYEGAILRIRDGTYREGYRSPHLLKVKAWEDDEFRIIDFTSGKGKFENAPVFGCLTKEGKRFEAVPKGSAEERYEMLQRAPQLIGQLLKVQYLGFTDEGAPKCARGIAIREPTDL